MQEISTYDFDPSRKKSRQEIEKKDHHNNFVLITLVIVLPFGQKTKTSFTRVACDRATYNWSWVKIGSGNNDFHGLTLRLVNGHRECQLQGELAPL
jgi:hypothetical protein